MSHLDEIEANKCLVAMEDNGLDPDVNGYCIAFDGQFQMNYDAVCVLEKTDENWHYFVFERGEYRNHAYFQNANKALNSLYWHFVSPTPNYTIIYNKFGKGSDAFVDQIKQEKEAFEFACQHLKIPPNKYRVEIGDYRHVEMSAGWICKPSKLGWSILEHKQGVDYLTGDFEDLWDALNFMFWSLTGAQTYEERYAEINAAG